MNPKQKKTLTEGNQQGSSPTNETNTGVHPPAHSGGGITAEANINIDRANAGNPVAIVPPEVAEIRQLHGELMDIGHRSLAKAIRIGELLTGLKKKVGHGKWEAFITENLKFDPRTVQNYMRLYREKDRFKNETVSDLPLAKAYLVLREPTSTTPSRKLRSVQKAAAPESDQDGGPQSESQGDEHFAPATAHQPGATASIAGSSGQQQPVDLPPDTEETDRKGDDVVPQFFDGTPVTGWQDGVVVSTKKLERELKKIADLPPSVPRAERLAQQKVFAAGASAINEVCGSNPHDGTLKAVEDALEELRNSVRTHKNYRA